MEIGKSCRGPTQRDHESCWGSPQRPLNHEKHLDLQPWEFSHSNQRGWRTRVSFGVDHREVKSGPNSRQEVIKYQKTHLVEAFKPPLDPWPSCEDRTSMQLTVNPTIHPDWLHQSTEGADERFFFLSTLFSPKGPVAGKNEVSFPVPCTHVCIATSVNVLGGQWEMFPDHPFIRRSS